MANKKKNDNWAEREEDKATSALNEDENPDAHEDGEELLEEETEEDGEDY